MRAGVALAISVIGLISSCIVASSQSKSDSNTLKVPSAFAGIADPGNRSRALFSEAAKVIMGPRCMNCHPNGDSPTQGNDLHIHMPPVTRGESGVGVAGNTCSACHTEHNYTLAVQASYRSIPGHIRWGMAPVGMAWQGKTVGEICRQLKDPARNGGRSLASLHDHIATDDLVAWAWQPGEGRDPAPGSQETLGMLVQAWIDTGAECP